MSSNISPSRHAKSRDRYAFASTVSRVLRALCAVALGSPFVGTAYAAAQGIAIEPRMVHLRDKPPREWSDFPETAEAASLDLRFEAARNDREFTLQWRQQDVKQLWNVQLNGKPLGTLVRDENDMVVYAAIGAGMLKSGENRLQIQAPAQPAQASDDIRVGAIRFQQRALCEVLDESQLEIEVVDEETSEPLPCRITIVDDNGSLQTTSAASNDELAVRPGTIYAARGMAKFGVPAGKYTVYAGRGFEYSLAWVHLDLAPGQSSRHRLRIRREVPTAGYVACDTHVHTLTHSGHGDATIAERLITLACEGIELPIATDHNIHVDYEALSQQLNLRRYFTPVIGNEVTTSIGHFNVFPVSAGARVPDYKRQTWAEIFDEIYSTPGVKIAILNHARDLHSGTRPFGPALHNRAAGVNLQAWPMRFNAMEVVNSSATQTDVMQLFRDWMTLLNRGYSVTPVGASDSHDVSRHFVGQGRTYIRCDDRDPAHIDVDAAVRHFVQGEVLVSYGLMVELNVDGYRSGELVPTNFDLIFVRVRVLGPHWVQPTRLQLFSNGSLIHDESLPSGSNRAQEPGVRWEGTIEIRRPKHDVFLTAIALGNGVTAPYWKTAKAYQPVSPDWEPHTIGCSGAVWLDADGDGQRTSARDYATRLCLAAAGDPKKLGQLLADYDAAVAVQAAHILRESGTDIDSDAFRAAIQAAPPQVRTGFRQYLDACVENDRARAQQ
jgi:hypothetical protein